MRTLCPNYDREDGLETVLEVPMPEELFRSEITNKSGAWQTVKSGFLRSPVPEKNNLSALLGGRDAEIQMLLGVSGAPSIPVCLHHDDELVHPISKITRNQTIEAAMAKYIVKQYIAASGGEMVLTAVENMYAMGKLKMGVTEFCHGPNTIKRRNKKTTRTKHRTSSRGEMGGFVLWKNGSEQWSLELVVSGYKLSSGCDGNVAWRQIPRNTRSHASKEPSAALRRFLQGLDPKMTADLFERSICVGEKTISGEECFLLKVETQAPEIKARNSNKQNAKHTVWGCFSQRTGLLVQLEDSYAVKIQTCPDHNSEAILYETRTETLIQDYRTVDGVVIAHKGKTRVSLSRFGESSGSHYKTTMEEIWEIDEVGFNVKGLSPDCFLPPGDLQTKEESEEDGLSVVDYTNMLPMKVSHGFSKLKSSKVTAIEDYDTCCA